MERKQLIFFTLLAIFIKSVVNQKSNVCPTYDDYYTIANNSRCWYDLAAENDVPNIIKLYKYPLETYKVITQDGFILTLFRIPSKSPNLKIKKHPVYLQHGLVATSANFVGLGKNSLAFQLADAGFDVWLGNYRGTQYSEGHVNLTVFDTSYWEHTMDEIALYDFPAIFAKILTATGEDSQIIFVGHSLGTSLALMYAAEYPEEAERSMKLFVLLSPAYTLKNIKSPYKNVVPFGDNIIDIVRSLKMLRILSQAEPLRRGVRTVCLESPPLMKLCMQIYNLFYGPNAQFGAEIIPVYFNQLPGGTSTLIWNHAGDLVRGNFRKYDYSEKNLKKYGAFYPPVYDIKKVKVPTYLIYSTGDWATTEKDALNLWRTLPKESRYGIKKIDLPRFNHIDFVFGRQAKEVVYNDIVKILTAAIN